MKTQWLGKNADLSMLCERVEPFFHEMGFETTLEKVSDGYRIQAVSEISDVQLKIEVNIYGQPNDFAVEFAAGADRGFLSMAVGYLTSMFGGGYLILRETKKREAFDKLENMFWEHMQKQVADLVNSATI